MCGWMNSPFFSAGSDGMAEQARPSAPAVALPWAMYFSTLPNCSVLMMVPISVFSSKGSPHHHGVHLLGHRVDEALEDRTFDIDAAGGGAALPPAG